MELVETTYRVHGAGDSVNPPSYFLRFPDRPSSRIIALPASIGGQVRVDGLKWISSFPENVAAGIPRASAVLILNDHDTGYPFACLESSIISATRTAASAALAADRLSRGRPRPPRVGFLGTGLIARYIHTFLTGTGWSFDEIGVHDLSADSAAGFRGYLEQSGAGGRITVHDSAEELIRPATWSSSPPSPQRPMSPTRPGSTTIRSCCTCPCATSHRRSCSATTISSTTSSTARRPTRRRTWRNSSPATATSLHGTLDDVIEGRVRRAGRPDGGVLAVRPRGAGPRRRQVRLRRGCPCRRLDRHRRLLPRTSSVRTGGIHRLPRGASPAPTTVGRATGRRTASPSANPAVAIRLPAGR